jgi:putative DNA primase/helicase
MWAVDIDPRHGGDETFRQLVDRHGRVPRTPVQVTGSGGLHLIFAWPAEGGIRNSAGKVGPGVDVRGDGGFIVLAPSLHKSGRRYRPKIRLDECPLAPAPDWLLELARRASARPRPAADQPAMIVPAGQRHQGMVSLLGCMRRWGASAPVLEAAAIAFVAHQCDHGDPPISIEHIRATAADIARRY